VESPEESSEYLGIVYQEKRIPGALAIVVPESRLDELKALEADRRRRVWTLRAVVADSVPLAGNLYEMIRLVPRCGLLLNEQTLTIYLHYGGDRAVYYDLVARETGELEYIQV
jgi:hypothetical protein